MKTALSIGLFCLAILAELLPVRAARFVYDGFSVDLSEFNAGGYGLTEGWRVRTFEPGSVSDYALRSGSLTLTGIASSDSSHLERVQGTGVTTIWRDFPEPLGAPATTKYLGFLMRLPTSNALLPTGLSAGVQLRGGGGDGIYVGAANSVGAKFRLRNLNGGIVRTSTTPLVEGQTYFCVVKLEFSASSTVCSLYVGGDESQAPDATITVFSTAFDSAGVTSNYNFSIDELRIADTVAELKQSAPSPPTVSALSGSFSTAEGNSGTNQLAIVLRLSRASEFPVYVKHSLIGASADSDDFVSARGQVKFAPGETEKTFFVGIRGDTIQEPDEIVYLFVNPLAGVSYGSFIGREMEVKILNDDIAPVEVTMFIERVGQSCFVNWIPSSTSLTLQSSTDLATWQNVTPVAYSTNAGPVEVAITGGAQYFRFGPP